VHNKDAARKREALDLRWRQIISETVRAGQRDGQFASHIDSDDFAIRLAALMDGLALQVVLNDPAVTTGKMRRLCLETAMQRLEFELPVKELRR
jgi:hypothetical protein